VDFAPRLPIAWAIDGARLACQTLETHAQSNQIPQIAVLAGGGVDRLAGGTLADQMWFYTRLIAV
jgi:hypothetical protein